MELNVINSSTGASVTSWANGLMDPPKSESWRRHKALRCGREYISAGPEIRPRLSILQGKLTVNSPNDALAAKLVGIEQEVLEQVHRKEQPMATVPPRQAYEYRELDSLEEVNRLSREDGFDLVQAVFTTSGMRYIVRRSEDQAESRRAGFSIPG